jgi:Ni,Fe-hydrogenase III small subunit
MTSHNKGGTSSRLRVTQMSSRESMTVAMRGPAKATLEATRPGVVVAIGDCAIGDGPWSNIGTAGPGAGVELSAEVCVPGCPPTPADIKRGLEQAAEVLQKGAAKKCPDRSTPTCQTSNVHPAFASVRSGT